MKLEITEDTATVTLSRKNLLSLLAKLDGHPKNSECTIAKDPDPFSATPYLIVKAEEDEIHYEKRGYPAGEMHPETERKIFSKDWTLEEDQAKIRSSTEEAQDD